MAQIPLDTQELPSGIILNDARSLACSALRCFTITGIWRHSQTIRTFTVRHLTTPFCLGPLNAGCGLCTCFLTLGLLRYCATFMDTSYGPAGGHGFYQMTAATSGEIWNPLIMVTVPVPIPTQEVKWHSPAQPWICWWVGHPRGDPFASRAYQLHLRSICWNGDVELPRQCKYLAASCACFRWSSVLPSSFVSACCRIYWSLELTN